MHSSSSEFTFSFISSHGRHLRILTQDLSVLEIDMGINKAKRIGNT